MHPPRCGLEAATLPAPSRSEGGMDMSVAAGGEAAHASADEGGETRLKALEAGGGRDPPAHRI
jgi:hypothetical protein